jgi:tRNA threonylcarbamoyladenosine biosynthesis protein TsaE
MFLADAAATEAVGLALARLVAPGDAIALSGPLGSGKTTLARGLLAGLGLAGDAPSPSFAIVQPYGPPELRVPLWHVDLFRLEDPAEAQELGLDDVRDEVVLVVEWPERLGRTQWLDALWLELVPEGAGRRLTAQVPPAWEGRWPPR